MDTLMDTKESLRWSNYKKLYNSRKRLKEKLVAITSKISYNNYRKLKKEFH